MKGQGRTHAFLVCVFDPWFVVLRIEPSGYIINIPVNMKTEPRAVIDFFLRYAKSSNEVRGLDASRQPVNPTIIELLPEECIPSDGSWLIEFDVPEENQATGEKLIRKVYALQQLKASKRLVGRRTSTWIAWDSHTRERVFLKEHWDSSGTLVGG